MPRGTPVWLCWHRQRILASGNAAAIWVLLTFLSPRHFSLFLSPRHFPLFLSPPTGPKPPDYKMAPSLENTTSCRVNVNPESFSEHPNALDHDTLKPRAVQATESFHRRSWSMPSASPTKPPQVRRDHSPRASGGRKQPYHIVRFCVGDPENDTTVFGFVDTVEQHHSKRGVALHTSGLTQDENRELVAHFNDFHQERSYRRIQNIVARLNQELGGQESSVQQKTVYEPGHAR